MSGSREILYNSKDFSGRPTDIYHSDKKMYYCKLKKIVLFAKNYFPKFAKFLRQNACEIKIFSSICRKN